MALKHFLAAILCLSPISAFAEGAMSNIDLFNFGGLNDSISSDLIENYEAQSALNVESNINGTAILKRSGYQQNAAVGVATGPVSGSYSFIDNAANTDQIVCNNTQCSVLVNGGAPTVFLTSNTIPNYWQFVDINGTMYGVNDKNDPPISYNGSSLSNIGGGAPNGAVIELTKDRLAIAGTAANPNRVYYSQSGVYTNFVTGVNSADPWTDDFGTTGDKITGLKYDRGRLFIFKRTSITACLVQDQYQTKCYPVSNNIGTSDPLSIVSAPDGIYFRAQDRTYWRLDDSGISLISKKIINFVKSQTTGSNQQNVQNTQAAWQAGTQVPGSSWNTATTVGSIFPSSSSFIDTTASSFSSGTASLVSVDSAVTSGAISSTYTIREEMNVLPETDNAWITGEVNGGYASVANSTLSLLSPNFSPNPQINNGVYIYYRYPTLYPGASGNMVSTFRAKLNSSTYNQPNAGFISHGGAFGFFGDSSNGNSIPAAGVVLSTGSVDYFVGGYKFTEVGTSISQTFSTYTILVSTYNTGFIWRNGTFIASGTVKPFIGSPAPTYFGMESFNVDGLQHNLGDVTMDVDFAYFAKNNVSSPGAVAIGVASTFTSRIFDTSYTTPTAGPFTSTNTVPTNTSLTWQVRSSTSPNNDLWNSYTSVVPPAQPTNANNRYFQYKVTLTPSGLIESPGITGVNLALATTGQFYTQCIQPPAGITSWGTLSCGQTLTGAGSEVFYTTSAASCAALPTSTQPPVNAAGAIQFGWAATTNNSAITISTNVAMFVGFRSLLGSATDQAQVDNCTVNWTVGTAAPPQWGVYDSLKNAIYWTSAINNSSSSNRVLKYDLNILQWFPMGLNANALREVNNQLYFGDSTAGKWYSYGNVQNDNGAAINSFWQSKDFHGTPNMSGNGAFNDTIWQDASVIARNQTSGSMTATWTTSQGAGSSYTISLSTTSTLNFVRANFTLPSTSPSPFFNIKFGNNVANNPWELDGLELGYYTNPWIPENP